MLLVLCAYVYMGYAPEINLMMMIIIAKAIYLFIIKSYPKYK